MVKNVYSIVSKYYDEFEESINKQIQSSYQKGFNVEIKYQIDNGAFTALIIEKEEKK